MLLYEIPLINLYRLVGFEELGNVDSFDTAVLELRLSQCGKSTNFLTRRDLHLIVHSGAIQKTSSNRDPLYKVASKKSNDDDDEFDL